MLEELKPCRFCGETKQLKVASPSDIYPHLLRRFYDSCSVWCQNCGAIGPECLNEEDAVKTWNAAWEANGDAQD